MADLQNPIFNDNNAAREHLEALHWPAGPECPHCMSVNKAAKLEGKSTRAGVYKCKECRKPFSVTVGTLFERSHIPLSKWMLAVHLLSASKKGISSHQLHRMLGVTYKTAWFMSHRIREAMRPTKNPKMGQGGNTVEADETYIGRIPGRKLRRGFGHKEKVFSLLERETGRVRSTHVARVTVDNLRPIMDRQLSKETHLRTDEANAYVGLGRRYASHESVNHRAEEYVRGGVYTNTVEGFFSIFKRGNDCADKVCSELYTLTSYQKEKVRRAFDDCFEEVRSRL